MKKFLAWLLVLSMTAAISIGATLAYLTDTDEDVNVMTLGKVKIDQLEYEREDVNAKDDDASVQEFHDNKHLLPAVIDKTNFNWETDENYVDWTQIGKDKYTSGIWNPDEINNELDKMVFVKNKGDYDAYVRSVFAFEANGYTLDQFKQLFHLNINESDWTWEWEENATSLPNEEGGTDTTNYIVATATYNKVLKPGEFTEISLAQIALDPTADNEDISGFGDTYQVLVYSQGIQANGFDDPQKALNEGFGEISTVPGQVNIPWVDDNPIEGTTAFDAVHYLNGDPTGTDITDTVTNVVFGLNKDYPAVVNDYVGTLVDVEQDVPVYAYYVETTDAYTVYFLANDDIFLPKDSTALFSGMDALKTLDTYNLNTSRTEIMKQMFDQCKKLEQIISLGTWDTSSLVSAWDMFKACSALNTLEGMQNWTFDNAVNLCGMLQSCTSLTDEDVAVVYNWDISNVEDISWFFKGCTGLVNIDLSNWDTGNVKKFNSIFSSANSNDGGMKLKSMGIENWDTSSAENMGYMFYGCGHLESIDLSQWDVSKNKTFNHFMTDCYKLTSVNFTGWDTGSCTHFGAMFNNCDSMKVLDVSSFDTHNAENFDQVFEYCYNLEQIIGLENWDTSNVWDFWEMFYCCYKLKELNLSSFNTSKVQCTYRTFASCSSLQTIYVGEGWDMSNVWESSAGMFSGCNSLVGGEGTRFADLNVTDLTYAKVDGGAENPGYLTHISDKPVAP